MLSLAFISALPLPAEGVTEHTQGFFYRYLLVVIKDYESAFNAVTLIYIP